MPELQKNKFKDAIQNGRRQIGLWVGTRDSVLTEMLAHTGFDCITIDCEHTMHDISSVVQGLQAMNGSGISAIVRPPSNDAVFLKRLLDAGVQNFVIPYVQNAEEARQAAAAVAYAPKGIRGVAGSTRATMFGSIPDYFVKARDEICLIVQVETQEALDNIEEIAAVDGVDGIFIGPADLAMSLGYPGQMKAPAVLEAIENGIRRITAAGKPAGFLSRDQESLDIAAKAGAVFLVPDIDTALLKEAALKRAASFQYLKD
ncbi:MAG: HpcH/HpaI aldolase/citrate lyase family protein [Paracoccaceae bacterium]|jgi:4-hydroxy-2-oxoheptanedioate aldolase|nr:HpcH/HpaI aldolase/citrate lyase family protein [Paracoccaceae bacterium]